MNHNKGVLACFEKYYYPKLWKHEWVVPAKKVSCPKLQKDLRKISLTSEFSLAFEGLMKEWIMEDNSSGIAFAIELAMTWVLLSSVLPLAMPSDYHPHPPR